MKRNFLLVIFLLFITILIFPIDVSAWSWQNIFKIEEGNIKESSINLSDQEIKLVESKYSFWKEAIANKDMSGIEESVENLNLSEEEANYLLAYHINKSKDPYFCVADLDFKANFITLEAFVLKPLSGNVSLDFVIMKKDGVFSIDILKASYKNIYIPSFFLNRPLNNILKDFFATVCSEGNCDNINFFISDDGVRLGLDSTF